VSAARHPEPGERLVPRPAHYDLVRTLSGLQMGPYDPHLRLEARRGRIALWTPAGAATLELLDTGEAIRAVGFGDGAEWALERVGPLLGLEDQPTGFDPPAGPVRELWRRFVGMRLPRLSLVFPRAVAVVLLQRVAWRDGVAAWARLLREQGSKAPGPLDLLLPPSPEQLAGTAEHDLVRMGVAHRPARAIRALARRADRLERAAALGRAALAEALQAIPGIGPWTVQYLLGSALGDPDAVLLGDYDLPATAAWILARERQGADDARLLELLEPYRGHRYRVIRLLWLSGAAPPRRGPRRPRPVPPGISGYARG
jgi:3-methyladenine DNA glycosylase/8-oxoguanine DNA glycosylase